MNLSRVPELSDTRDKIKAFWELDPEIRTFQAKAKEILEVSSDSATMSSKY